MTAVARALSRMTGIDIDVESLRAVVAFSCIGLIVSLLFIIYGFDLLP
jgi:hypothetical protein